MKLVNKYTQKEVGEKISFHEKELRAISEKRKQLSVQAKSHRDKIQYWKEFDKRQLKLI